MANDEKRSGRGKKFRKPAAACIAKVLFCALSASCWLSAAAAGPAKLPGSTQESGTLFTSHKKPIPSIPDRRMKRRLEMKKTDCPDPAKRLNGLAWHRMAKDNVTPEEARLATASGLPPGLVPVKENLAEVTDFYAVAGGPHAVRRPVLLLCEIDSEREETVYASAGADYFFAVFCNGATCVSTLEHGNGGTPPSAFDRVFGIPLRAGKNTLGFYVQSGMGGWKGAFRFQPGTPEILRRLSRNAAVKEAFPARNALRYGPWITHPESTGAVIRFTTEGELAVCADCREKNGGGWRRFYELQNGHPRNDTDRHAIVLENLLPGTEYEFRIGLIPKVTVANGWLPAPQKVELLPGTYTFRTLPPPGEPTRFFAVSDTHLPRRARLEALEHAEKLFAITGGDFMLHLGDIASSINCFDDDILGGYAGFFNRGGRLTPLVNVHGNHEYSGEESALWNSAFADPSGKAYYAFRSGDCFFAVLNYLDGTGAVEEIPSNLDDHKRKQKEWLASIMKSKAFLSAKYRIFCNHCPPVRMKKPGGPVRSAVYEILDLPGKSPWTLVLCGHEHQRYRATVCGVPVLCLGGGEKPQALVFTELQAGPEKLAIRLSSGDGKLLGKFDMTPDGKIEDKVIDGLEIL